MHNWAKHEEEENNFAKGNLQDSYTNRVMEGKEINHDKMQEEETKCEYKYELENRERTVYPPTTT